MKAHNVFHASLLKKYVYDTKHVIDWSFLQEEPEGEFVSEPLHILDKREVQLKKWTIVQLKVQWNHFRPEEATWENETALKEAYPSLFQGFIWK